MQHRRGNEAHNAALEAEHWLAWFLSALAILLAVLGLLRAYGIIGPENTTAAGQVTSISPGGLPDTYWDGGLLLLAALSSALLAFALHRNDHHRMRDLAAIPDREENLWKTEHLLAYVMVVASVAFAIIGVVTGYNKDGGHHWQPDGIPWLLTSIGAAILANVLHSVQHHQLAHEEHGTQRTGTEGFVQERRGELSETPPTRSQR
jgi:hypothetical protein